MKARLPIRLQRPGSGKRLLAAALLVAGVITLLVSSLAFFLRRRHPHRAEQPPPPLPVNVNQQLSGYTFTRSEGGQRIFTVHAARALSYKGGGRTLLQDVDVEVYGAEGTRRDLIRTKQCDYNTSSGGLECAGVVSIELRSVGQMQPSTDVRKKQPLFMDTQGIAYHPRQQIAVSSKLVTFRLGPATGKAVGMIYHTDEGDVELERDVALQMPAPANTTPNDPIHLHSGRLVYNKKASTVTLAAPVEIVQGSRQLHSGAARLILDNSGRVSQVQFAGPVQASSLSADGNIQGSAQSVEGNFDPATGVISTLVAQGQVIVKADNSERQGARRLKADRVELHFTGSPAHPRQGNAKGHVKLTLLQEAARRHDARGASPDEGAKVMTADEVRFSIRQEGSLQEAHTVGAGRMLLIPSAAADGWREVSAGEFQMTFDQRSQLRRLLGLAPTRIALHSSASRTQPPVVQQSEADQLEAEVDPNTQQISTITQRGRVRIQNGDQFANGSQAVYRGALQEVELTGHPVAWNPDSRIRADRLLVLLNNNEAQGWGHVECTHFLAGSGKPRPAAATDVRDGAKADAENADAVHVLADHVTALRQDNLAHFRGHVRAWYQSNVIESEKLDVNGAARRMDSPGPVTTSLVETSMLAPGAEPGAGKPKAAPQPVVIRADRLEYLDAQRIAVYHGHVQASSGDAVLTASKLTVYFSPANNSSQEQVERLVAQGQVKVTQPGRLVQGDRADYQVAEGKVVMTGGPPSIYDEQQGFTTGQSLTFFMQGASLFVDGGNKLQTLSKRQIARH